MNINLLEEIVAKELFIFRDTMKTGLKEQTNAAIRSGNKLQGVRYIRVIFGCSLKDCQIIVDSVRDGECISSISPELFTVKR